MAVIIPKMEPFLETPWMCPQCNRQFFHSTGLEEHVKKHGWSSKLADQQQDTTATAVNQHPTSATAVNQQHASMTADFEQHTSLAADFEQHASLTADFEQHASLAADFQQHASLTADFQLHAPTNKELMNQNHQINTPKQVQTFQELDDAPSVDDSTLVSHLREKEKVEKYYCPDCRTSKINFKSILTHIVSKVHQEKVQNRYGSEKGQCGLCYIILDSTSQLDNHLVNIHKILKKNYDFATRPSSMPSNSADEFLLQEDCEITEETPLHCFKCNMQKNGKNQILAHLAIKHYRKLLRPLYGKNEWQCSKCDKECKDERFLLAHLACEHGQLQKYLPPGMFGNLAIVKMKEEVDDTTNNKLFSLSNEIPSEDGQTKSCQSTDIPISESSKMEKTFSCHICQFKINSGIELKSHLAFVHLRKKVGEILGSKEGECAKCGKIFGSKNQLLLHIADDHATSIELSSQKPESDELIPKEQSVEVEQCKFNCHLCYKTFRSYSYLVTHIAIVHLNDKLRSNFGLISNQCGICDKVICLCKHKKQYSPWGKYK